MKPYRAKLNLLIPGLFGPMPSFASSDVKWSIPKLERWLSRADVTSVAGKDYLTSLFSLFGYPLNGNADLPVAAVNYLAEGGDLGDFCYMRADPVHLRPDRDRLLLFNSEQLDITLSEAEMIAGEFNQHFAQEAIRLVSPNPEHWYLQLEQCPSLQTCDLNEVVGHHIETFMPLGPAARRWRQLNNEMQMLLFQSSVNQQREAAGHLTINGIWLSGIGKLPVIPAAKYGKVYADDSTAQGISELAKVRIERISELDKVSWSEGEENLMVLTDLISPVLHADPYRWAEALQGLEQRLDGLIACMYRMKQACLVLYPCNGESYMLTTVAMRRFWRRRKSISAFMR